MPVIQVFEHAKYLVLEFWLNANTDIDAGLGLSAHIFDGVVDEVLPHFCQPYRIAVDIRHVGLDVGFDAA